MVRITVAATTLNTWLAERAKVMPSCDLCVLGTVVEIPVDETGCNWRVSVIQGSHCVDCLSSLGDFIAGLREQFLLKSRDDMDPTLLTTWAMR